MSPTKSAFNCLNSIIETPKIRVTCSKLTIKTPERRHWCCSTAFIVTSEQISHHVLVIPLFTLNKWIASGHYPHPVKTPYKWFYICNISAGCRRGYNIVLISNGVHHRHKLKHNFNKTTQLKTLSICSKLTIKTPEQRDCLK